MSQDQKDPEQKFSDFLIFPALPKELKSYDMVNFQDMYDELKSEAKCYLDDSSASNFRAWRINMLKYKAWFEETLGSLLGTLENKVDQTGLQGIGAKCSRFFSGWRQITEQGPILLDLEDVIVQQDYTPRKEKLTKPGNSRERIEFKKPFNRVNSYIKVAGDRHYNEWAQALGLKNNLDENERTRTLKGHVLTFISGLNRKDGKWVTKKAMAKPLGNINDEDADKVVSTLNAAVHVQSELDPVLEFLQQDNPDTAGSKIAVASDTITVTTRFIDAAWTAAKMRTELDGQRQRIKGDSDMNAWFTCKGNGTLEIIKGSTASSKGKGSKKHANDDEEPTASGSGVREEGAKRRKK